MLEGVSTISGSVLGERFKTLVLLHITVRMKNFVSSVA